MTPTIHHSNSGGTGGPPADLGDLLKLLTLGDSSQLTATLKTVDPWSVCGQAATEQPAALCAMPPQDLAPELQALRAIARTRSSHEREESTIQLYEAAHALAREEKYGWAEAAVHYWTEAVHFMSLPFDEATRMGLALLDASPGLRTNSPISVAMIAASASACSSEQFDIEAARCLWNEALTHQHTGSDSDEYWIIQIMWAAHHVLPREGSPSRALRILTTGHNHFAGRSDTIAIDQAHFASMNMAIAQFQMGHSDAGLRHLTAAIRSYAPNGIHAAFLDAVRSLLLADLGRAEEAQEALDRAEQLVPQNNMGARVAVLGPARLLIAAHRSPERVLDGIAQLAACEEQGDCYGEDQAFWRIVAGRALEHVGLIDAARSMLHEADTYAQRGAMPYHQAWAMLRCAHLERDLDSDCARRCISIARSIEAADLLVERERERSVTVCIDAIAQGVDGSDSQFIRRVFRRLGRTHVDRVAHACESADASPKLRALWSELGWSESNAATPVIEPAIDIRLLGGLNVCIHGHDISQGPEWDGRKKARHLLALLAAARGPVHIDVISDGLWGNSDSTATAKNIRPLVHTVRKVLAQGATETSTDELLTNRYGSYELHLPAAARCDLHDFHDAAEECRTAGDPVTAIAAGQRALSAYGGEFVAGEGFEAWMVTEREYCWNVWQATVLRTAQLLVQRGELHAVRVHLEALLDRDPGCEEACRLVMRMYFDADDHPQISEAYHRTVQFLRDEHGLAPSERTRALFSQLFAGETGDRNTFATSTADY